MLMTNKCIRMLRHDVLGVDEQFLYRTRCHDELSAWYFYLILKWES